MGLSDKVKSICDANYKNNCGNRPIRLSCVSSVGYGSEGLRKWVEYEFIKADEVDCTWRTADDNSEIAYEWNVTHWMPLPEPPKGERNDE